LMIDTVDSPYAHDKELRGFISERGLG